MTVSVILSNKGHNVFTVDPDEKVEAVAQLLAGKRIGAVLATSGDGKVVGIVSERDLIRAIAQKGASALKRPISDFMTTNVVTCQGTDSIAVLMEKMTAGKFRHLPVLKGGKLDGIVSIGDVVKQRIAETEFEANAMREYISTG
jgi:CBS domain-containing protein